MAHDRRVRRMGRREAIALFGLLAGMASAAMLTQVAGRMPQAERSPS